MKVVVVGNNVAGTFSAQNIRYLNEEVDIEIYTQESYPYYTRVNLPELISGRVQIDDLIVFKNDWYQDKRIKLNLNQKVTKIEPDKKILFIDETFKENNFKEFKRVLDICGLEDNPFNT